MTPRAARIAFENAVNEVVDDSVPVLGADQPDTEAETEGAWVRVLVVHNTEPPEFYESNRTIQSADMSATVYAPVGETTHADTLVEHIRSTLANTELNGLYFGDGLFEDLVAEDDEELSNFVGVRVVFAVNYEQG